MKFRPIYFYKEAKRIDDYEIVLKTADKWLKNLIAKNTSEEEIRKWFNGYKEYMGDELNNNFIEIYSVIDKKIIGATDWEGAKNINLNNTRWYNKAIQANGKIVFTNLYKDIKTGEDSFTIALKINEKNDVLAIDIFTKELMAQDYYNSLDFPQDTYYYLCDSNGKLIYMKSKINNNMVLIQKYVDKIVEEANETIRVLGNSYYGIYKINFKEKTYIMIKGSDYIRSLVPQKGNYKDLEEKLYEVIEDDSKDEFRKAFSIENMTNLVKNRVQDFGGDF